MLKFNVTEVRLITGIDAKNLYNYKKRNQLVQGNDKLYDYNNPVNKDFFDLKGKPGKIHEVLELRKQKEQKLKQKKIVTKKVKTKIPKFEKKPGPKPKKKPEPKKRVYTHKEKEEKQIKLPKQELSELSKVNLEQKKLSIEKARFELEEKRGNLISLEKTLTITSSYSDKLKKGLLERMRIFIQDICARHEIETGKTGEYKLKIADIINNMNDQAINELLKEFK